MRRAWRWAARGGGPPRAGVRAAGWARRRACGGLGAAASVRRAARGGMGAAGCERWARAAARSLESQRRAAGRGQASRRCRVVVARAEVAAAHSSKVTVP
ncbi:hypothetical protein Apa02nite_002720 [Actinoplanes palleronii]|uniref:Uncharacterized protein n=1 Tax=Actinoplanes palleronii TaxID=113570 RepID=A0ABQ4B0H5_9ACTN|nr:hypothetical protein Apa02nite_002720 [Actinoplanes palleronii]